MTIYKRIISSIGFLLMLLLIGQQVQASKLMSSVWVIDHEHQLSQHMHQYAEKLLKELEKTDHTHLSLLILNAKESESLKDIAVQNIVAWEAKYPQKQQAKKSCYLVLDLAKQQALILLGNQVPRTPELENSLQTVKTGIILPALQEGRMEKAIVEGLFGLSVALHDWPQANVNAFNSQYLKWGFIALLLIGVIYGLRKYFQPLQSKPVTITLSAEEELFLRNHKSYSTLLDLEQ